MNIFSMILFGIVAGYGLSMAWRVFRVEGFSVEVVILAGLSIGLMILGFSIVTVLQTDEPQVTPCDTITINDRTYIPEDCAGF